MCRVFTFIFNARIHRNHSGFAGFTLIELLVVISIIGLLSSVVLVALSNARNTAKGGVVTQELLQFRNLYELNYATNGNYANLQPTSFATFCSQYPSSTGYYCNAQTLPDCTSIFDPSTGVAGVRDTNALAICTNIIQSQINTGSAVLWFEIGVATNTGLNQKYSVYAYLPGQNKYQCFGSSKLNSLFAGPPSHSAGGDNFPGCSGNP